MATAAPGAVSFACVVVAVEDDACVCCCLGPSPLFTALPLPVLDGRSSEASNARAMRSARGTSSISNRSNVDMLKCAPPPSMIGSRFGAAIM